jgi:hypothetical protein
LPYNDLGFYLFQFNWQFNWLKYLRNVGSKQLANQIKINHKEVYY